MLPDEPSAVQPGDGYNPPPRLEPPPPFGWVGVPPDLSAAAFGLLVEGHAMSPDYPHGSVAVCGPWVRGGAAAPGRCYVFKLTGRPGLFLLRVAGGTPDAVLVGQSAYPGRVARIPRADVRRFAAVLACRMPDAAATSKISA